MTEPIAVYQTAEPMTPKQRREWIRKHCAEGNHGHARATFDPDFGLLLLELWKERPEDEGHPRFNLGSLH